MATVTQRIGEIQSRIAALSAPTRVSGAASGAAFSTALSAAVQEKPSVAGAAAAPSALTAQDQVAGARLRASGSAASAAGGLNADGVPRELAKYGNGKIPASALTEIGRGNHRLWAPAADQFKALSAAAAKDGVKIGVTDSYRSYEAQVDVARRKGLYSEGGLAAKPGTSDHGWGRSLDLDLDSRALTWMRANGEKYGFVEDTPRESWHWTYYPPK